MALHSAPYLIQSRTTLLSMLCAVLTVPMSLVVVPTPYFQLRLSDFSFGVLLLIIVVRAIKKRLVFDQISLILFLIPTHWMILSFSTGQLNTPTLNNVRYYFTYGLIYLFVRNSLLLQPVPVLCCVLGGVLHSLYGFFAIRDMWSQGVVLHDLHAKDFKNFSLNNWGFTSALYFLGAVFWSDFSRIRSRLNPKGQTAASVRTVLSSFSALAFACSVLSISRAAIVASSLGLAIHLIARKGIAFASGFLCLLCAWAGLVFMVDDIGMGRFENYFLQKSESFLSDVVHVRVELIIWQSMRDFFSESTSTELLLGGVGLQQHSSLIMSLFHGGLIGVVAYMLLIVFCIRELRTAGSLLIVSLYFLNEFSTNASAYWPGSGYLFFFFMGLIAAEKDRDRFAIPTLPSRHFLR